MPETYEREDTQRERGKQQNIAQNTATFNRPILAAVNDEPVTIMAIGDVVGHSPSFLVVQENKKAKWISLQDVDVLDTQYLPPSRESLQRLGRSIR